MLSGEAELPELDARRTSERQEATLLIKLYRRHKKDILLSLGEPFTAKQPQIAKGLGRLKQHPLFRNSLK